MALLIIREDMNAICGEGIEIQFQYVQYLLGMLLCCSSLCIECIKCTEPLNFDSPAGTEGVRKFPTFAKVFVSTMDRNRSRDLPQGKNRL